MIGGGRVKDKIVIGLVGPIKAGKTLTAEYFKQYHDAVVYRFSRILSDVLNILCLPLSRENLQDLAIILRKRFGSNILVPALKQKIRLPDVSVVVVDGIRVWEEAQMVRDLGGFLIYITASDEVRFKRLQSAEKFGEELQTYEQFLESQQKETELLIAEIGQSADHIIDNSGSMNQLPHMLYEIVEKEEMYEKRRKISAGIYRS